MGCDIHGWVEHKTGGKWIAISPLNDNASLRNYSRFAALAGVRGDGPEPKGVPDDVSETTRYWINNWGDDGHSHSWIPISDAAKVFSETAYTNPHNASEVQCYSASYFFDLYGEDLQDYRLVYWFDN